MKFSMHALISVLMSVAVILTVILASVPEAPRWVAIIAACVNALIEFYTHPTGANSPVSKT